MSDSKTIAWALFALLSAGCSEAAPEASEQTLRAESLSNHECAVCGMVVAEQPAPRAQVVHRDGTRRYFCSQGDLMSHLQAPSPHGAVQATFVEALDPLVKLEDVGKSERAWIPAEAAQYLVGRKRRGIMGEPVLVYAADATDVPTGEGEEILSYTQLKDRWEARR